MFDCTIVYRTPGFAVTGDRLKHNNCITQLYKACYCLSFSGEAGGAYLFRPSFESWGKIDNANGLLDVNSFTFTAWFKPGEG